MKTKPNQTKKFKLVLTRETDQVRYNRTAFRCFSGVSLICFPFVRLHFPWQELFAADGRGPEEMHALALLGMQVQDKKLGLILLKDLKVIFYC